MSAGTPELPTPAAGAQTSPLPRVETRSTPRSGVGTLLWLKSREFLGENRSPTRLRVLALLLLCWFALAIGGIIRAAHVGKLTPQIDLRYFTAAAWALWALVPLLGGGGEVVASQRLAPYPVEPRAIFRGTWAAATLDAPYLVAVPMVVGLSIAYDGLAGLILAASFILGSSAMGQLAAWCSSYLLTGRKRTGVASLLLTGSVVGGLAIAPTILHSSLRLGELLPGGWAYSALYFQHTGSWDLWGRTIAGFLAVAVTAYLIGPRITAATLRRESRARGVGARSWGSAGWAAAGTPLRLLAVTSLRSTFRAVGAQVAVVGVLAIPTLSQLPGFEIAQINLIAMGAIAGLASSTVLGVNSFAFDAGGASMALSLPVRTRDVLLGKALAVASLLLLAQTLATLLGALVLHAGLDELGLELVHDLARTLLLTGVSLCWSVNFPSPSDYDSLRARIAAPASILSFIPAAGMCCYFVSQFSHYLTGFAGAGGVVLLAATTAAGLLALAHQRLVSEGRERVALGVAN